MFNRTSSHVKRQILPDRKNNDRELYKKQDRPTNVFLRVKKIRLKGQGP
jgi:hypothetical protein